MTIIEALAACMAKPGVTAAKRSAGRREGIEKCVSIVEPLFVSWSGYGSATAGARASLLEDLSTEFRALLDAPIEPS